MPRLAKKLTRKIAAPRSTLRQVSATKKSDRKSNIRVQLAARFQNRLEKLQHYLFRGAFEIEVGFFGDFPELVETARARAFECEHFNQEIEHVSSFDEPCLEAFTTLVVVVEICV